MLRYVGVPTFRILSKCRQSHIGYVDPMLGLNPFHEDQAGNQAAREAVFQPNGRDMESAPWIVDDSRPGNNGMMFLPNDTNAERSGGHGVLEWYSKEWSS